MSMLKAVKDGIKSGLKCSAIAIVALVGLTYTISILPVSQDNAEAVMELVQDNIVMITPEDKPTGGTGFIIVWGEGYKSIMTNAHICALYVFGQLKAISGVTDEVIGHLAIEYADPTKDLCLLGFTFVSADLDLSMLGLKLRDKGPAIAEKIYNVGHPGLEPMTVTAGYVITPSLFLNVWGFITNAKAYPGSSGSPVVDRNGEVVGVVFASDMFDNAQIIHYREIKEFLEDAMQATKEEEEDNADLQ